MSVVFRQQSSGLKAAMAIERAGNSQQILCLKVEEGLGPHGCFRKHCLDGWTGTALKWYSCVLGTLSLLDGSL